MWIYKNKNSKGIRYKYTERFKHPVIKKTIALTVTLNSNNRHAQKKAMELLQNKFKEK